MGERIDYAAVLSERSKLLILAAVLSALFLTSLDQTIVSAALPNILADLGDLDLLPWTSTAYLLVSTTALPVFGKLSDLYGRKGVLLFGMAAFLVGSMLCGFAPSMLALVVSRGVQGLGASAIGAVSMTIPADLYVPAERAKLQGWLAAVFGLSGIIGPFLGGFLTDTISWHWIFYINLPFGLPAMLFVLLAMPPLDSGLRQKATIDWLGSALLVLTVVPFLVAFSLDRERFPWSGSFVWLLLTVAAVSLAGLVTVEQRASEPLLPPALFQIPVFNIACAISMMTGGCFITVLLFLPIFLVNVLGTTATGAGIALLPETLGFMVTALASGQLVQRTGRYKAVLVSGIALMAVGFWGLSLLELDTPVQVIWLWTGVLGLGIGATFPQVNLALQNAVPMADVGAATAGRMFFVQLSQTVGATVFGALLAAQLTTTLAAELKPLARQLPGPAAAYLEPYRLRDGGSRVTTALAQLDTELVRARFSDRGRIALQARTTIRRAFADAVAMVFRCALPIAGLAVVLGLLLPELPLRRSNASPSPAVGLET